jgi:hypothetical protein
MKRLVAAFLLFAGILHAEPRTFTDQFGRSITAELISVDGDQIRIRRDDGQVFTLAASKLTDTDQQYIKTWSAANPASTGEKTEAVKAAPDPKKLIVGLSRAKFNTRVLTKFDTYVHKHEDWGYSIQLTNQNLGPIQNVRVEYNLFARTFSDSSSPSLISGAKNIDAIRSRDSSVFRTASAEVCKTKDTYFGMNSGGEMRGIWLRIYVDGQLLIEQSSPETLMQNEKWTKIRDE